MEIRKT